MLQERKLNIGLGEFIGNKNLREQIQNNLSKNENSNLLDLGSGIPFSSTMYFHFFFIDKIYCVDRRSEKECIEYGKTISISENNTEILKKSNNFWDWYQEICKSGLLYHAWNKNLPHSDFITRKENFQNRYNLFLEKDIVDFFNENKLLKFNIIFLINVLHLMKIKEMKQIIRLCKKSLSEDGMIFIRYQAITDMEKGKRFQNLLFQEFRKGTVFYMNDGIFFSNSYV